MLIVVSVLTRDVYEILVIVLRIAYMNLRSLKSTAYKTQYRIIVSSHFAVSHFAVSEPNFSVTASILYLPFPTLNSLPFPSRVFLFCISPSLPPKYRTP